MKKIFAMAVFCLISTLLIAQPHAGHSVSFKSVPQYRFHLYVDGVLQNKKSTSSLTINNVPGGIHQLTVIMDVKNHPQSFYQIRLNDRDLFFDIEVTGDPRVQYVIHFKPAHPFNFPVEMIKDYFSNNHSTFVAPPQQNNPPYNQPGQPGHQPQQPGHPGPGQPGHQPQQPGHPGQPGHPNDHGNHGNHQPGVVPAEPVILPCPEPEFVQIKQAVSRQNFSSDKMKVAKQAIPGHNLTAMQIKDLALMFTFDSDRLELLKFAYQFCFDPQNYYLVYEVLTYSSSKDELDKYISGVRF